MKYSLSLALAVAVAILAVSPPPVLAQARTDTAATPAVVQAEARLSVTFLNASLRDVVANFASFAGRTIVMHSDLGNQRVTAEINNQPWRIALNSILSSNGLMTVDGYNGIINIQRKTPAVIPPTPGD
jgi:type II secretory pathway component GspD/PulD (secretin)